MAKVTIEVDLCAPQVELAKIVEGLTVMCGLTTNAQEFFTTTSGELPDIGKMQALVDEHLKGKDVTATLMAEAKQESQKLQEVPAPTTKPVAAVIPQAVMPAIPKAVMPTAPTPAPAPAPVAVAAAPVAVAPGVSIMTLRELMAEKVTDHVDVLRTKLASFGTTSISALKPEYYDEFYAYLQSLA